MLDDIFSDEKITEISRREIEDDKDFTEAFDSRHKFMKLAFEKAEEALTNLEVPVGCVFVYKNEIIGSGRNDVNVSRNPTRHAEMVAFEQILDYCKEHSLDSLEVFKETTLYVTLEPCMMCASALQQLQIPRIFFGASNERFGGIISVGNIKTYQENPPSMDIIAGIGTTFAVKLLKDFYKNTNMRAPIEKRIDKTVKNENNL
uniref:CMP/dCMP-type deaminase domain-containing protein n=1 Tax=Panagrolaimus superbus TaxID=310955 RepID=A0A914Y9G6_9BILA